MEIEYQTSRDQARETKRAEFMSFRLIRFVNRFGSYIFPLVFFVCFLIISLPFGDNATINDEPSPLLDAALTIPLIAGASLLLGLGLQFFLRHIGRMIVLESIEKLPDCAFGRRRIILGEHTISIRSPMTSVDYDWRIVSGFEDTRDYIVLKGLGGALLMLPKKAFTSREQEDAFVEELSKHSKL